MMTSEQIALLDSFTLDKFMFLIRKVRLADVKYLTWWFEATVQNPITSFWTVIFSTYGSVCLEFLQIVTSETILKEKQLYSFCKHGPCIFISCLLE